MQKDLLEGMVEVMQGRERPRMQWTDIITPGADPENVELGGGGGGGCCANSINNQTQLGGGAQIYFLVLQIRAHPARAPSKSAPARN